MKKCPNKERNSQECGCTYAECERKGVCCECIRHHRERGEIPGCLFPKQAEKLMTALFGILLEVSINLNEKRK